MARRVRDATLDSREARRALKPRGKPYFKSIGPGLHIGYRKGRSGGVWLARIYVGNARYEYEKLGPADDNIDRNGATVFDFWQAQELARHYHADRAKGDARFSGYTVRDAIADYLHWMEGNKKTAHDARCRAESLILPFLGETELEKLTAAEIRNWHRRLSETPPMLRRKKGVDKPKFGELNQSPEGVRRRRATANRTLTILKAALNMAWREKRVASDEEWRRVKPFENVASARLRYLTISEAQRLINACEPVFRKLVQAALQTGARYGELSAMTVGDFNIDSGTVLVDASKSGKSRHIELTDEGVEFFRSVTLGRGSAEPIFVNKVGKAWGKSHQNRPMAQACANGNISPPIGFHGLRHTWASHAVMNGMPLLVVAKNLGHSDTRMVEKHYGHLRRDYIKKAINDHAPRFGTTETSNVVSL